MVNERILICSMCTKEESIVTVTRSSKDESENHVSGGYACYSVDRNKYQIHIPLPPKIDPTVTMMQVEEKPDVTYSDVGGCKEQIEKLREVVETPLLHVS
jgi:ATP-dependent 26S proteasome regulatory subunit